MGECHMRIEISAFVMRTFVLVKLVLCHRVESETIVNYGGEEEVFLGNCFADADISVS